MERPARVAQASNNRPDREATNFCWKLKTTMHLVVWGMAGASGRQSFGSCWNLPGSMPLIIQGIWRIVIIQMNAAWAACAGTRDGGSAGRPDRPERKRVG